MRIVLYDQEDLEPITILEINHWREFGLPEGAPIRVAVRPKVTTSGSSDTAIMDPLKIVNIKFERLHRNGAKHWLAVTTDAESAMLLKAAFLPGQYSELQERERKAFASGFLDALDRVIRS